jgi:pantetheine-phosphate adenylyltransferase
MNASELQEWIISNCGPRLAEACGEPEVSRVAHDLALRWTERQRDWHGAEHLRSLVEAFDAISTGEKKTVLVLAALFHDAVYDPTRNDNEDCSAALLERAAMAPESVLIRKTCDLIRATKWNGKPMDSLTQEFFEFDAGQLGSEISVSERMAYERAIFKEYQFHAWPAYRVGRLEFLKTWSSWYPQHAKGAAACAELLQVMQPKLAIYPGSFNPFHIGHLSVVRQAEQIFDKVIVALGVNRQKFQTNGSIEEIIQGRHDRLKQQMKFHQVDLFSGLLPDYLSGLEDSVTVIRGVRDGTDLEADLRYARFLKDLGAKAPVIWVACEAATQHISSSAVRELESLRAGAGAAYVPDAAKIYGIHQS